MPYDLRGIGQIDIHSTSSNIVNFSVETKLIQRESGLKASRGRLRLIGTDLC